LLYEQSDALRENVDAYATNIDSWGHRFVPAMDLDADDIEGRIFEALFAHRVETRGLLDVESVAALEPTPDAVAAALRRVRLLSRAERARIEAWFDSCTETTFVALRRQTREDLEITGNAYWEVVRDARRMPARLSFTSSMSMRITKLDNGSVKVREPVRTSSITWREAEIPYRFRRFVQIDENEQPKTWFKQFGDPRVMSSESGRVYATLEEFRAEEEGVKPATEIIHFRIHSPRSAYGVPRWAGRLLAVLGSRAMEEVNLSYFNNKSVPPMAVLVSGGARLNSDSVERIERFIKENIRGRENFWSILLLQAEDDPKRRDGRAPKIELKPLTDAQLDDATHQVYNETNTTKIGRSFRLPNLLRGDAKDFNRATAEASLRFAEDQVFAPEREAFDSYMNRVLMPAIGARFWGFQSKTHVTRDPERTSAMLRDLVKVGVLTPEEARVLASDVFNVELPKLDEDWVKRPITLTLAGIQTSQRAPDQRRMVAEKLRDLREVMLDDQELEQLELVRLFTNENDDFG
jgi:PBSX family phage portal protein